MRDEVEEDGGCEFDVTDIDAQKRPPSEFCSVVQRSLTLPKKITAIDE